MIMVEATPPQHERLINALNNRKYHFEGKKKGYNITHVSEISFYDIIHMLIAKKTKSVLITRDNKLIEIAKKYSAEVMRPEEVS